MLRAWRVSGLLVLEGASATVRFHRALFGAVLLGFHALLRGSEYSWKRPASKWSVQAGLARQDVKFSRFEQVGGVSVPTVMELDIKQSKTDVFRYGNKFVFFRYGYSL